MKYLPISLVESCIVLDIFNIDLDPSKFCINKVSIMKDKVQCPGIIIVIIDVNLGNYAFVVLKIAVNELH